MLVLGLDPARVGAGVLVHDGRVVAAMHWRTHTSAGRRLYALECSDAAGADVFQTRGLKTPWTLGMAIRKWLSPQVITKGPLHLAAEAAHIGRNPRTGLALSRWGGAMVGPIEDMTPRGETVWVEPDEWRKKIFRTRWWKMQASEVNLQASMSKANQIALMQWEPSEHPGYTQRHKEKWLKAKAKEYFLPKREAAKREAARCLPELYPNIVELADRVGGHEHVYDAAGIARFGLTNG